ncbi:hypothetical protein FGE12_25190 [Aggregicoccus sp. 17bor-14]|uniref:DUF6920 family protein n=1 Tax=Myxococcaceae TaxID=31 RepID=UPI00129C6BAD|nr:MULTISPECIES: DUF6544 family protein [Myxococcaceae]MBF5045727.1 hypothetical protein [Simulacricoccus sp. 17bor-14]MRI91463.1 hypothetical protein [Aggregicoccus sp. 17bor-14]
MRPWSGIGLLVVGGAVGAVALAHARWRRDTAWAVVQLERLEPAGRTVSAELPAPVARYFAFALPAGQAPIRGAHEVQRGEFLLRPGTWSPMRAEQHFSGGTPGFVWDASIRMNPLLTVRVRDSYLRGEGRMLGKVEALVPVVDQHGTREMAEASLQRWLAETVWLPTALLPREGLTWSALDAHTARVTVQDSGVSASADFRFGAQGEIVEVSALRYRDVDGRPVLTPWKGRFWSYERVDGMQVPRGAEVGWELPEGLQLYWRARLESFEYALEQR